MAIFNPSLQGVMKYSVAVRPLAATVPGYVYMVLLLMLLLIGIGQWYASVAAILLAGIVLMGIERNNMASWPIAPASLFWLGHLLCFIIGPAAFVMAGDEYSYFLKFEYPFGIYVVAVAMLCFSLGSLLGSYLIPIAGRSPDTDVVQRLISGISWHKIFPLVLIWPLVYLAGYFAPPDSFYAYLMGGLLGINLQWFPYIFMILVVLNRQRTIFHILAAMIFLFFRYDTFYAAGSGREGLLKVILVFFLAVLAWADRNRRHIVILPAFLILFTGAILLSGVMAEFRGVLSREGVGYGGETSVQQRQDMLQYAAVSLGRSETGYQRVMADGLGRLYEDRGMKLINLSQTRDEPYGMWGLTELAEQYIPAYFFKTKSMWMRDTAILINEGLLFMTGSCPITLPADAYYRMHMPGIILFYFLHGVGCIFLSRYLVRTGKLWMGLAYLIFCVMQIRLYVMDTFALVVYYIYFLPIATILNWALVRLLLNRSTEQTSARTLNGPNLQLKPGRF